jgi:hypothetical protein
MTRSNKVTVYVNDAELSRLEREANDRNMSRSGYVLGAIQRQWRDDDADEAADRMNAEEKVEQIVADAREELVGIARSVDQRNEDVADMTARAGSYSIANFELLKDEFDPAESRKAETLLTGSRRLREPLEDHPDRDLDVDEEEESDELDEYGLDPEEDYYDIKHEEAQDRNGDLSIFGRSKLTEREAEYLRGIEEDDRTDKQQERLKKFERQQAAREREAEEWKEERAEIHWQARQEHKRRNSGLSGIFR